MASLRLLSLSKYAYDRESGEIVAYVWGKRNLKTAKKLRKKLYFDRLNNHLNWELVIPKFALTIGKVLLPPLNQIITILEKIKQWE
jgi:hypothetical protein